MRNTLEKHLMSIMKAINLSLSKYYREQAGQKKYLDALVKLANPGIDDIVLDVGTGSGTVSFFLGDKVKEIYGIDPDENEIYKRQEESIEFVKSQNPPVETRIIFKVLGAEQVGEHFPNSFFDTIVCWASIHHFYDYRKAMKGINLSCKPGGKILIFDAFLPEPVREFWEMASTIHDPTTVHHHTYFEYMEMLRLNSFIPEMIIPFRHTVGLENWLDKINRPDNVYRSDFNVAEKIKFLHPGKYDKWLEKAMQKGLKNSLKQEILSLPHEKQEFMSLISLGNNEYEFSYDTFVLSAVRVKRAQ